MTILTIALGWFSLFETSAENSASEQQSTGIEQVNQAVNQMDQGVLQWLMGHTRKKLIGEVLIHNAALLDASRHLLPRVASERRELTIRSLCLDDKYLIGTRKLHKKLTPVSCNSDQTSCLLRSKYASTIKCDKTETNFTAGRRVLDVTSGQGSSVSAAPSPKNRTSGQLHAARRAADGDTCRTIGQKHSGQMGA